MALSQALSEEEFHRMQAQLLELRTQNYQLSDDLRKNSAELNAVRQKNAVLERDFVKAQKALNKSKKAQEVEALLSENEMLQGKLHSQEDDFRLQNSTLMTELSKERFDMEQQRQPVAEGNQSAAMETAGANGVSDATGKGEEPTSEGANERLEQASKQAEITKLQEEITKFSASAGREGGSVQRQQVTGELREQLQSKEKEHELALHTLRDQVANQSAVSQEQVDSILQENDALRTNLAALEQENSALRTNLSALEQIQTVKTQEMNLLREQQEALTLDLQQRRAEQESLLNQRDDLDSQLQESSFANRKLLEQLTEEGQEKDKLLKDLDEAKKTAEKRKAMLDEMAVQLMQEKSDHKEALSDLKLQHEKEVLGVRARYEKELRGLHEDKNRSEEEIRQQLRDEKARSKALEGLQQRVEELQAQVLSMEGTKGWFERRLKEAEENIEKKTLEHQEEVERLQKEHTLQLEVGGCSLEEFSIMKIEKCPHVSPCLCVLQEKQTEMEGLNQQLQEVEKQKEEHNAAMEKLKQVTGETPTSVGMDMRIWRSSGGAGSVRDQQSQSESAHRRLVLSLLLSYRDMMKESQPTNQNKSGGGSPQSQRPAELSDDEWGSLFQRLAEVKHLEVSCSSMAEDICRKSSIIETYVMDSRIAGGQSLAERNREEEDH
ncbi:hypothetical protein F7725_001267 [Dissostichus mawsoni]|uniref:GRIP1-associated protein 1 n=1 Tax=Dissostichus mawsoni TaxID=36200 RepID=A0A7J5ZGR4_DISMA|nr:hypothetical protein F7725_001267 [Dissostichus mawsoni]